MSNSERNVKTIGRRDGGFIPLFYELIMRQNVKIILRILAARK